MNFAKTAWGRVRLSPCDYDDRDAAVVDAGFCGFMVWVGVTWLAENVGLKVFLNLVGGSDV